MKNKILIIIGILVTILLLSGLVTSYIDSARVRNSIEPKYTIKIVSENGNKVTYWGLGYKVVRYVSVSPNEPYENNRGVKYGSWFMEYKLEDSLITPEDVNDKIINYIKKENNDTKNYSYNYVDTEKNKVVVGLVDNTKEKQDEFIYKVFSSCCGSKYIKYIQDNSMIEFKDSKYTFEAKIIFVEDDYITVKVLKDIDQFKKDDKVTMAITRPNNGTNDFYVIGNNVKIIFNGNVLTSNPAQIGAIKIELIN